MQHVGVLAPEHVSGADDAVPAAETVEGAAGAEIDGDPDRVVREHGRVRAALAVHLVIARAAVEVVATAPTEQQTVAVLGEQVVDAVPAAELIAPTSPVSLATTISYVARHRETSR